MIKKENDRVGVYSQVYVQVIFAVKNRESLIHGKWEDILYKYITGIVKNKGQKLLAINGMPDHVHILLALKTSCRLSDLIRDLKKGSNEFVNSKGFTKFKFQWQEGYGAFSYSRSALDDVINYINRQKEHHEKIAFSQEYKYFLMKYEIEFKDEYLFKWIN